MLERFYYLEPETNRINGYVEDPCDDWGPGIEVGGVRQTREQLLNADYGVLLPKEDCHAATIVTYNRKKSSSSITRKKVSSRYQRLRLSIKH